MKLLCNTTSNCWSFGNRSDGIVAIFSIEAFHREYSLYLIYIIRKKLKPIYQLKMNAYHVTIRLGKMGGNKVLGCMRGSSAFADCHFAIFHHLILLTSYKQTWPPLPQLSFNHEVYQSIRPPFYFYLYHPLSAHQHSSNYLPPPQSISSPSTACRLR